MFPKVVKAGAGPHDLGPGNNYDETLPELTTQMSSESDAGFDNRGDSAMDYLNPATSHDPGLELYHHVSSVRRAPPAGCQF